MRTQRIGAALTATATFASNLTAINRIRAALIATAFGNATIDEPREVIYVEAEDRNTKIESSSRTVYVEKYTNMVAVTSDGTRKVSVAESSRSYQLGKDDRSIPIDAEDRDVLVPATRPESLLKND
jgi:hypothetical protein